ncbi:unnamed protein product [Ambrosiozyma monospora]|uniref:Unnamed protein product n=1 Tax=Ambrosiozyma monospora TaxID=43982 RepID=A0ACB5T493_AMBMO|nr:unnamed protein product [Ambrosiozyma monospora]
MSCNVGLPYLVNDEFSDVGVPQTPNADSSVVLANLLRELSKEMNSVEPISLNDAISLHKKISRFNSSLGTFREILSTHNLQFSIPLSQSALNEIAHKIKLKLITLKQLSSLSSTLCSMLENLTYYPSFELTTENITILKQTSTYYESFFLSTALVGWSLVRELSSTDTIFGTQHLKYIMYFKSELSHLLTDSLVSLSFSISSDPIRSIIHHSFMKRCLTNTLNAHEVQVSSSDRSTNNSSAPSNEENENSHKILDIIDYGEIEKMMDPDANQNDLKDLFIKIQTSFDDPKSTIKLMCYLHEIGSSIPLLSESYHYFVILKALSVSACFSHSVMKLTNDNKTDKNITGEKLNLTELFEQTRTEIEQSMQSGYVDLGFSLDSDAEQSFKGWMDSMFDLNLIELIPQELCGDSSFFPFSDTGISEQLPPQPQKYPEFEPNTDMNSSATMTNETSSYNVSSPSHTTNNNNNKNIFPWVTSVYSNNGGNLPHYTNAVASPLSDVRSQNPLINKNNLKEH